MRLLPLLLSATMAAAFIYSPAARAGDYARRNVPVYNYVPAETYGYHDGRYVPARYRLFDGNHPHPLAYPSTYPWAIPVSYTAGPGNYYPAGGEAQRVRQQGQQTGYPPRQYYITNYNGYAPQYGFR